MSAEGISETACRRYQKDCRTEMFDKMESQHGETLDMLSNIRSALDYREGHEDAERETATHRPVNNGNGQNKLPPWVRDMAIEVAKVIITAALLGGLWAYFEKDRIVNNTAYSHPASPTSSVPKIPAVGP